MIKNLYHCLSKTIAQFAGISKPFFLLLHGCDPGFLILLLKLLLLRPIVSAPRDGHGAHVEVLGRHGLGLLHVGGAHLVIEVVEQVVHGAATLPANKGRSE